MISVMSQCYEFSNGGMKRLGGAEFLYYSPIMVVHSSLNLKEAGELQEEVQRNNVPRFEFAYDVTNNILHLYDDGEHHNMSLINTIDEKFKDKLLKNLTLLLQM